MSRLRKSLLASVVAVALAANAVAPALGQGFRFGGGHGFGGGAAFAPHFSGGAPRGAPGLGGALGGFGGGPRGGLPLGRPGMFSGFPGLGGLPGLGRPMGPFPGRPPGFNGGFARPYLGGGPAGPAFGPGGVAGHLPGLRGLRPGAGPGAGWGPAFRPAQNLGPMRGAFTSREMGRPNFAGAARWSGGYAPGGWGQMGWGQVGWGHRPWGGAYWGAPGYALGNGGWGYGWGGGWNNFGWLAAGLALGAGVGLASAYYYDDPFFYPAALGFLYAPFSYAYLPYDFYDPFWPLGCPPAYALYPAFYAPPLYALPVMGVALGPPVYPVEVLAPPIYAAPMAFDPYEAPGVSYASYGVALW